MPGSIKDVGSNPDELPPPRDGPKGPKVVDLLGKDLFTFDISNARLFLETVLDANVGCRAISLPHEIIFLSVTLLQFVPSENAGTLPPVSSDTITMPSNREEAGILGVKAGRIIVVKSATLNTGKVGLLNFLSISSK